MLRERRETSRSVCRFVLKETVTLTGQLDFARQLIFNSASSLWGAGGLVIESGLYATNSVNNTFTGPVTIRGGLWGGNVGATFGQSSQVTVEAGGAIQLFGTSSFTANRPLSLTGSGSAAVGGYALAASGGGTKTWSGPIVPGGDVVVQAFGTTATSLLLSGLLELRGVHLTASPSAGHLVATTGVVSGLGEVRVNAVAGVQGLYLAGTIPTRSWDDPGQLGHVVHRA